MNGNKLTDYYRMQEIKILKSHRYDCTASTGSYPSFEAIANSSKVERFYKSASPMCAKYAHIGLGYGKFPIMGILSCMICFDKRKCGND
jgi:hypothetical protein